MVLHGIALYCMVLYGIAWYCMVLHGIAWYCMVLHGIAWYCMAVHVIALSCIILHYLALSCTILHYPALSCTIADSAQTEYCPTFHCSSVRSCVTGVTSHISHIYKGINAMLIIRDPLTPIYSESKSSCHPGYHSSKDQTRQGHLLRPDQPDH